MTCENEGYLIDLSKMAENLFNFTLVSLRDPDNDWGVTPKSGPYNRSGTWGGVMGGVSVRRALRSRKLSYAESTPNLVRVKAPREWWTKLF